MTPKANIDELRKILSYLSSGYKVPKIIYDVVFEIAKREVEDKKRVVLIKRDPDVHKERIQSVYPKIIDGETINVHPGIVGGFGADFDGDSVDCFVKIYRKCENGFKEEVVHISKFCDAVESIVLKDIKYREEDNVIVTNYHVLDDVYVKAIDVFTGEVDYKLVTHWSVHQDVKMYDIQSNVCELDDDVLSVTEDHSIVAYDVEEEKFVRVTPLDLKNDPEKYYLVKSKQ